eukprot:5588991-Alexandrium_andersonii.AAC.1
MSGAGVQAGDEDDNAATSLKLHSQILWLESMHQSTSFDAFLESRLRRSRPMAGVWNEDMGCFAAYKPAFLLECILMSFGIRSSKDVADVMASALQLLPKVWQNSIREHLARAPTPSPSTLTRARLTVDTAYMVWMRRKRALTLMEDGCAMFMKFDSTPMAGFNWEVVEYELVKACDLARAGQISRQMAVLTQDARAHGSDLSAADAATLARMSEELSGMLSHHVLPLGALGTRQSAVEHILHSILYRLRLECFTWLDVQKLVASVFSLTVDQGTESHVADVETVDVDAYFPYWRRLRMDGDAAADDEDGGSEATFRTSVRIPPHFHIVDEITEALLGSLGRTWPQLKPAFQAVLVFFHARHT